MSDVSTLLGRVAAGDREALDQVVTLVGTELRRIADHHMRAESPDHTLQPTALVHEAYMRLVGQTPVQCESRTHFLAIASKKMREILRNHARDGGAQKRGGGWRRIALEDDIGEVQRDGFQIVAFEEALANLEASSPRLAEVLQLRLLSGLHTDEIATRLGLSVRQTQRDLKAAAMIFLQAYSESA